MHQTSAYNNNQSTIVEIDQMDSSFLIPSSSSSRCSTCITITVKRATKRWPLCIFYGMIDIAAINAMIIWKTKNPQWNQNIKHKRRLFLEELGLA
ncbi:unnamed protein product [Rotaria sp. Silwood1]|nr:unnamed protein product [Rotaria sp. Silwood1]